MSNEHIKIWTRYTVPKEYEYLLEAYDDDSVENTIENVSFIAHVPQIVVEDEIIKMSCSDVESEELNISKLFERGFLGSNGIDTIAHPEGDGYFIVGGRV